MDYRLADQLGRELAWSHCRQAGIVSEQMCKEAGLLEGIIFAPLTAIAAMISAPWGSKMRSMGMGLLLGAGMGAVADKEVANRQSQGEPVTTKEMGPAMKAIMAGVALGGSHRVQKDLVTGKPISQFGGILVGAPLGALVASSPSTGMAVGAISGSLLSSFQQARPGQNPIQAALGAISGVTQQVPQQTMAGPAGQLMQQIPQADPKRPILAQLQAAQQMAQAQSQMPTMASQVVPQASAMGMATPQALQSFLNR